MVDFLQAFFFFAFIPSLPCFCFVKTMSPCFLQGFLVFFILRLQLYLSALSCIMTQLFSKVIFCHFCGSVANDSFPASTKLPAGVGARQERDSLACSHFVSSLFMQTALTHRKGRERKYILIP